MARIPTADELSRLVAAGSAESVTLEFKAEPWERNDQGKREALKDITALANTRGGLILIGVMEENNAATGVAPISAADAETERGRINDLITNGVEPRLYGVNVEAVAINGGAVLAINVPRSPSRPHRVTSGNSNRFWLRHSTGAYEANVPDLKGLFLQSAEVTERAERYHRERIAQMRAGDIVENLNGDPSSLIMHVIPGDAFSSASAVDLKRAFELRYKFHPIGVLTGFSSRFTFDGFLNFRDGVTCHGYTLVLRNGIVEGLKIKLSNGDNIPIYKTEALIVLAAGDYAQGLAALGLVPPFYAYVTLQGAGGRRIAYEGYEKDDNEPIKRQDLHLPVAVIETWDSPQAVAAAFRPALDALWNAGGHEGSPAFATGQWTERG